MFTVQKISYWKASQFGHSSNCSLKEKNQIRISCEYAHLYSMSLSITKVHEVLLSGLEELQWQTVSVVYLILATFSNFNRGITPRKKIESEFSANMHIYTVCPS